MKTLLLFLASSIGLSPVTLDDIIPDPPTILQRVTAFMLDWWLFIASLAAVAFVSFVAFRPIHRPRPLKSKLPPGYTPSQN